MRIQQLSLGSHSKTSNIKLKIMKKIKKILLIVFISICATSCTSCSEESYSVPSYSNGYNVSFQGGVKNSCNIRSHNCAFGVDRNSDGWCDNCWNNGYKCHMVNHSGN